MWIAQIGTYARTSISVAQRQALKGMAERGETNEHWRHRDQMRCHDYRYRSSCACNCSHNRKKLEVGERINE